MTPLVLTSMAAASTSIGGCCAVLLQRKVYILMSFGSGILIGAACLDLLPSALSAAANSGSTRWLVPLIAMMGGLLIFSLDFLAGHVPAHGQSQHAGSRVSAGFMVIHSTLDGAAIFAASTVSLQLGLIVGFGVVAHDICDGLNTILLATGGKKAGWTDYGFLALDALAPIAGGLIAANLFHVSPKLVMVFLSLAAGSFLFTAFFGLLPEVCRCGRKNTSPWLIVAGVALIFCLTRLAGALA